MTLMPPGPSLPLAGMQRAPCSQTLKTQKQPARYCQKAEPGPLEQSGLSGILHDVGGGQGDAVIAGGREVWHILRWARQQQPSQT
eukprot:7562926-Lingulodinium_polyedra.AAC.1